MEFRALFGVGGTHIRASITKRRYHEIEVHNFRFGELVLHQIRSLILIFAGAFLWRDHCFR